MSAHLTSLFLFAASSPPVDSVRQSLAAHSDRMFFWLVISSVVTGIGVIFEAPGEIHELNRWWKLKRIGKKTGWKIPIAFIGLVLVIGGILGEGIFEFLSSDAETAIRGHDEQVLGDTIIQAGTAKDSADAAVASASLAKEAASEAVGKADKANGLSGNAVRLSTGARKEADSFEAEISSAKKESERLKEQLADRTLTDDQQKSIAAKMLKFSGQEYEVVAYWDSQESLGIANRVHQALLMARWKYNEEGGKSVMLGGAVGMQIWHHPDADGSTKDAATALSLSLNSNGLATVERKENPTNNPKHNRILLRVGAKR